MAQYDPHNPLHPPQNKPAVLPHGASHHTPATQHLLKLATGVAKSLIGGRRKKKRTASATKTPRRRRRSRTTKSAGTARGKAHLVKGSSAAKSHMAKLRKMRKKA
jgi:hypothetical protein